MRRCLKNIETDEGIKYQPPAVVDENESLPHVDGIKTADEQIKEEQAKSPSKPKMEFSTPEVEKPKVQASAAAAKVEEAKVQEADKVDKSMKELEDKITVIKERGNTHFKKQAYKEAIKQFSEAINMFESTGVPYATGDLKLKIT